MTFYRVSYRNLDGRQGAEFFTSRAAAKREAARYKREVADTDPTTDIDRIEVVPTRAGILAALNAYGSHPDNG